MSEVPLADRDLAALVPEWLDWNQVAELLGVTPGKVRTMMPKNQLVLHFLSARIVITVFHQELPL